MTPAEKTTNCLILLLFLAACAFAALNPDSSSHAANSPYVSLDDPVYLILDALPFAGMVNGVNTSARPHTEHDIQALLEYALDNGIAADTVLIKHYLAAFRKNEIDREVKNRWPKLNVAHENSWLSLSPTYSASLSVQDSGFSKTGFKTYEIDSLSNSRGFNTSNDVGIDVAANIHNLVMYFNGRITTRYSTTDEWYKLNNPQKGQFYTTIFADEGEPGHFIGSDLFRTYLILPTRFLNVKIGNDDVSWGHSKEWNLVMSRMKRTFFNVQLEKNLGCLDYRFIWGKLIADTYSQRRYLYAKRFNYMPAEWITLGFSDLVVTINRDVDPVYFIPFLPYYFSEHFIGDPDNRLMSFDIYTKFRRYFALYGELFMDDIMNFMSFFSNKDANDKVATLLGLKIFNPIPRTLSLLTVEFMRIEPWVYTTSARENNDSAYNYPVHLGQIIGNPYGPHSRALKIDLTAHLSKRVSVGLQVEQIWKGDSAGSSVFDINPHVTDTASDGTEFSRQQYETKEYRFEALARNRTIVTARFDYHPSYWCMIFAEASAVREREPRIDNSVRVQIGVRFNY